MHIKALLQKHDIDRRDIEILLSDALKVNRAYLYTHPDYVLTPIELSVFQENFRRRKQGEPIAYITQKREFWSLNFTVSPSTLIPRPETELLVETILAKLPAILSSPILELGTGTGAISIALAKERPLWEIVAIDVSDKALAVAKKNADHHQVKNVSFCKSHWYEALKDKKFSAIVSNPPYLAENDPHLVQGDLRFEPKNALVAGYTGLEAFLQIIGSARDYLMDQGWLFLEHGFDQHRAIQTFFFDKGFEDIKTLYDYNDLPRVTLGKALK